MLHIVLGLVAIGLALFLWERFPAFKWIVISVIGFLVLVVIGSIAYFKNQKNERDAAELRERQKYETNLMEQNNKKNESSRLSNMSDDELRKFWIELQKDAIKKDSQSAEKPAN